MPRNAADTAALQVAGRLTRSLPLTRPFGLPVHVARPRRLHSVKRRFLVSSEGTIYFGASEATIFSKRGSPRNGSQNGSSFNWP